MAVTAISRQATTPVRMPYRLSIETAGFFVLLVGAWGGIVPFVGPLFGFSADGSTSWTWNLAHTMLFLVPGAVACFAALIMMIEGLSIGRARRMLLTFGGLLVVLCGAWFVIGPFAWTAFNQPQFFVAVGSPLREFLYYVGYSLGPGVLLLILGAFVLGRPRGNVVRPIVAPAPTVTTLPATTEPLVES